jgi:hypothetical protein
MTKPIAPVREVFESLERFDLSRLLEGAVYEVMEVPLGDSPWGDVTTRHSSSSPIRRCCDNRLNPPPVFGRSDIGEQLPKADLFCGRGPDTMLPSNLCMRL